VGHQISVSFDIRCSSSFIVILPLIIAIHSIHYFN
jgi:hypothetical protein